jgi:large subunit ribosomal protein MRP49
MAMVEISLSLDHEPHIPPIAEHQPVEFACAGPADAQLALMIGGVVLEPFLRPGEPSWRWRWNPATAVGLHQITLTATWPDTSTTQCAWVLRVIPRKLDQDRYESLLLDLQRTAYSILYTLAGASAEGAVLQREPPWQNNPLETYYALFEQRFDRFARAVGRIAARPREHLRGEEDHVPLGQAATLGPAALAQLARGEFDEAPAGIAQTLQEALRPGGGLLPRSVPTTHGTPTSDIYEHRLLKHLLTLLLRRARFIGELATRELARLEANEHAIGSARRQRVSAIAAGCADVTRRLYDLRSLPFLAEVQPLSAFRGATTLLRRDAAYAEVYRMWMEQRQQPFVAFDSPLFYLPIADLPHLYEIWCAIQVARALLTLGGIVREQRLVERRAAEDAQDELDFAVNLVEQVPLLVVEYGAWTLTLRYQPRYRPLGSSASPRLGSLDRHIRIPDLAIEARHPAAPLRVLLLDAKYRLDAEGRSVPQDALADAYTYLGAIGASGARATLGALLLYPGLGTPELYPSGVGAVPLLPERASALANVLEAQFRQS